MDFSLAQRQTAEAFSSSIVPRLCDYIRIPNKSPDFDPDWKAHGHMDRAADLSRNAAWTTNARQIQAAATPSGERAFPAFGFSGFPHHAGCATGVFGSTGGLG